MLGGSDDGRIRVELEIAPGYLEEVLTALDEVEPGIGFSDAKLDRLDRRQEWKAKMRFAYYTPTEKIEVALRSLAEGGLIRRWRYETKKDSPKFR